MSKLWFPYKQMKNLPEVPKLKKANGVILEFENGLSCIDGISSWWSVIHGYNHPELNKAITNQLQDFSHIMLGGISHHPANILAEKLVEITPEGLNHVFFSDSGSVGVEVALKMAIQYWNNKGNTLKSKFVSLKRGYHGDTFKAMEVSDDSDFTKAFSNVLNHSYKVSIPEGGFNANEFQINKALDELEQVFLNFSDQIAAFIVEPIVQCAGGFHIYSPEYLDKAFMLCKKYDVLFIFDEVATGFGRTGKLFAANYTNFSPDIMILGKALTAGYLGHAATITSSEVYSTFLGDSYDNAFMHGPTFMGNALACSVAYKGIEIFQNENYLNKIAKINSILEYELKSIKSKNIIDIRIIGAIGAIELKDSFLLKGFNEFAMQNNAWLRPIDNVVYIMPAYVISDAELKQLITVVKDWIEQKTV